MSVDGLEILRLSTKKEAPSYSGEKTSEEEHGSSAVRMRQTPSAIFMYRIDSGKIMEANDGAVILYGFSHKKLRQMTVYDLQAPFVQGCTGSPEVDAGYGSGAPLIFSHRRSDGSCFPVEILWGVYYLGDKSYGYLVCRDVSQRNGCHGEADHQFHL